MHELVYQRSYPHNIIMLLATWVAYAPCRYHTMYTNQAQILGIEQRTEIRQSGDSYYM